MCKISSCTGRTAHFRAVGAQRAALTPNVRPVAPTTIGWPIWPAIDCARPCECHGTITHITAAAVGVCSHRPQTERLRLAPCHRWCRTCDSPTHYWDFSSNQRELALGADAGNQDLSVLVTRGARARGARARGARARGARARGARARGARARGPRCESPRSEARDRGVGARSQPEVCVTHDVAKKCIQHNTIIYSSCVTVGVGLSASLWLRLGHK